MTELDQWLDEASGTISRLGGLAGGWSDEVLMHEAAGFMVEITALVEEHGTLAGAPLSEKCRLADRIIAFYEKMPSIPQRYLQRCWDSA